MFSTQTLCFPPNPVFSTPWDPVARTLGLQPCIFHLALMESAGFVYGTLGTELVECHQV